MALLDDILNLDAELGKHGFHELSPWWRDELIKFYRSGCRVWAAQVGRGGSKSTVLAKIALGEVLFGAFQIPPGERHFYVFCSARADEAKSRLRLIASYLDALQIPHRRSGDVIELAAMPRGFYVLPATIGSVSGHRALGFCGDECAKWRSDRDSANPAGEIAASARAMLVTHPAAKMCFFSSPLARTGFHFDLIEKGTTKTQYVSTAPTWIANPSITEAETRELELDVRIWSREYLAVPQSAALGAFDPDHIQAAMQPRETLGKPLGRYCVVDPSRGGGDSFAWGICGWNVLPDGTKLFVVDSIRAFEGRRKNLEAVVRAICADAKRRGCSQVFSDQGGDGLCPAAFRRHGLRYREHGWSSASKPRAVETLRRLLIEEQLVLPDDRKLRAELLAFEETVTDSAQLTYGARRGQKDDRVAVLISAMHAEIKGRLSGSPSRRKDPRPTVGPRLEMAGPAESKLDRIGRRMGLVDPGGSRFGGY